MMGKLIAVNEYHLSADDTRIVFHNGDDDSMTLEYDGKVFKGRALHREKTALGFMVSAELETVPDLHTVVLSVAVPEANRPSNAKSISVSTFAVFTTARTSIAGPGGISGQIRDFKVVVLQGNAW